MSDLAMTFAIGAGIGLACCVVGWFLGSRYQRRKYINERLAAWRAQPPPEPQQIHLVGGPFDGKEIKIDNRGIETVALPMLAHSLGAIFTEEGMEFPSRPQFKAVKYRRSVTHYDYAGED